MVEIPIVNGLYKPTNITRGALSCRSRQQTLSTWRIFEDYVRLPEIWCNVTFHEAPFCVRTCETLGLANGTQLKFGLGASKSLR